MAILLVNCYTTIIQLKGYDSRISVYSITLLFLKKQHIDGRWTKVTPLIGRKKPAVKPKHYNQVCISKDLPELELADLILQYESWINEFHRMLSSICFHSRFLCIICLYSRFLSWWQKSHFSNKMTGNKMKGKREKHLQKGVMLKC